MTTPPDKAPPAREKAGILDSLTRHVREIAAEVKKDLQPVQVARGVGAPEAAGMVREGSVGMPRQALATLGVGLPVEGEARLLAEEEPVPAVTPRQQRLLETLRNPWDALRDASNPLQLMADAYYHPYTPEDLDVYVKTRQQAANGFATVSLVAVEAGDAALVEGLSKIVREVPGTLGAVGFGPRNLQDDLDAMDARLTELLNANPHFLTVGPVGLDANYSPATLPEQKAQLARQLEIAADFDLPVLLMHNKAGKELLETLRGVTTPKRMLFLKPLRDETDVEIVQEFDCHIPLRAELTHPNMEFYRAQVKNILPQRVLLASGNSLRTTHNRAGQFNASAALPEVLAAAAEAMKMPEQALLGRTNGNFAALFGPLV